jgi:uncharacterized phage protein (predicted DNA packaging)
MKFLTLDYIKQHLRLDSTCEAEMLELYGASAEATLLNHLGRTYDEVIELYGEMPAPLIQAALMLVDVSYAHRSPVSPTNMSIVPYTFDIIVKPYVKL